MEKSYKLSIIKFSHFAINYPNYSEGYLEKHSNSGTSSKEDFQAISMARDSSNNCLNLPKLVGWIGRFLHADYRTKSPTITRGIRRFRGNAITRLAEARLPSKEIWHGRISPETVGEITSLGRIACSWYKRAEALLHCTNRGFPSSWNFLKISFRHLRYRATNFPQHFSNLRHLR